MKKMVAFFFVALLALGLVACNNEKTEPEYEYGYGIAYGLVHGHYVGVIEVVTDKDDKVVTAKIDEYYLPYNLGQVTLTDEQKTTLPADVVSVTTSRGTSYYAKYMSVAGTVFTIEVAGTAPAQSFIYKAPGIDNIENWVKTEANALAYVNALKADQVFVSNATGTKVTTYPMANANTKLGILKSATHYWTWNASASTYYPLGWGGNMNAIVQSIIGTKMNATEEQLVKDGTWKIGDVTTGATLTDFADYYLLAKVAYNKAVASDAKYGYGIAYGLVHGHYVGKTEMLVDKDDKVVFVKIDEYYMPYNLGQVTLTDEQKTTLPADVVSVTTSRGTSYYAKYMSVAGTVFTIEVSGTAPAQSFIYKAAGIDNIENWVKTPANALAYVNALEAGNVFVSNATGTKVTTYPMANANAKLGILKSATHYWTWNSTAKAYYPLGWGGNMNQIISGLIGSMMDATEEQLVKDGTWKIGDVTTGATLTDFADYYLLAQVAYQNALASKTE